MGSWRFLGVNFGMGEAGSSIVVEVLSRRVEDTVPWSFLTLEFLKLSVGMRRFSLFRVFMLGSYVFFARIFSGPSQKNFAETRGAESSIKNCSALDCVVNGLLRGKRMFASGRRRVREEGRSCA